MLFSIELFNFRNYPNKIYEFNDQVTLIKGVSGSGKSSILWAIEWCLFGKQKNVVPLKFKGKKCNSFVTIKTEEFEITRKKINNELIVLISEEKFTGDEAQSSIDFIFGDRERFNILCYIQQKKINQFFELKDSEKFDFLNRLSYENDRVRILKNKISEKSQELREEFKTIEIIFKHDNQRMMNEFRNINCEFNSSIDLDGLTHENEDLIKSIEQSTQTINQFEMNSKLIQSFEEEIKSSLHEINSIKLLSEDEVKMISYELNGLKHFKEQLILKSENEKEILQVEFKISRIKLSSEINREIKFSSQEIQEAFYLEKKIIENQISAEKIGLDYSTLTPELIESNKLEIKRKLELHQKIEEYKKFITLNEQLNQKIKECDAIRISSIDFFGLINDLKLKLEELKGRSYQCPVCSSHLKLKDNNELVHSTSIHLNEIEKKQLTDQLQSLERDKKKNEVNLKLKERLKNEIEQLRSTIELIYGHFKIDSDIISSSNQMINSKELNQKLNILNRIELLTSGQFKSDDMSKKNDLIDLNSKLNTLKIKSIKFDDMNEVKFSLEDIDQKISEFKNQLREQQKNSFQSNHLNEKLIKLKFKHKQLNQTIIHSSEEIEELKLLIEQSRLKIKLNEQLIIQLKECKRFKELQDSIKSNELKLNQIDSDIKSLNELKLKIESLECKFLSKLIDTINHYMNYCLNHLFDTEIKVTLNLESNSRTKKNCILLNIIKSGDLYPDISYLSGGELDRLSLSLSLSLNRIFDCMFISMDEIFSSLDINIRSKCIELFKELHLNVILISHDEIEGTFDQVIEIE
jgi:DNA repair exonuclease SbcCD ATPase subunit